jgi:hypothetical protein
LRDSRIVRLQGVALTTFLKAFSIRPKLCSVPRTQEDAVSRCLIFICFFLLFPLPQSEAWTVVDKGKLDKSGGVDCGDLIQFYKDAKIKDEEIPYDNAIAIKCNSESVAGCCWLQMLWYSVEVQKEGTTSPEYVDQTILTSSGAVKLSKPSKPFWHVDSAQKNRGDRGDKKDPCHETKGASILEKDALTIYDQPSNIIDAVAADKKKDKSVESIKFEGHFKDFLICDGKICGTILWEVTYTWTAANGGATTGPQYSAGQPQKGGSLDQDQRTALTDQYPKQAAALVP